MIIAGDVLVCLLYCFIIVFLDLVCLFVCGCWSGCFECFVLEFGYLLVNSVVVLVELVVWFGFVPYD